MLSLKERLITLEKDLLANPIKISVYHNLPFAIFCYPPNEEFAFRREMFLFKTRLENQSKKIILISLSELFWKAIDENDSLHNLINLERQFGFNRVQETIRTFLSDEDFSPLHRMILERIKDANTDNHIVFLYRAGAMAPDFYRMSTLLNELHGNTMVPIILFYPGEKEGETQLRFMGIEGRQAISGYNYRVKIY